MYLIGAVVVVMMTMVVMKMMVVAELNTPGKPFEGDIIRSNATSLTLLPELMTRKHTLHVHARADIHYGFVLPY